MYIYYYYIFIFVIWVYVFAHKDKEGHCGSTFWLCHTVHGRRMLNIMVHRVA